MSIVYKILGILGAVFAVIFGAKQWGRESVKRESAERGLKDAKKSNRIDDAVRSMPESELDKRLRKRTRKRV